MTLSRKLFDFSSFCNQLRERLDLGAADWSAQTDLVGNLALDSLQMLELAVFMDELGAEILEELLPQLQTLGDLYDHYITRVSAEGRW